MTLDERKATILRAVVEEYIETAQPVGSGHVAAAPGRQRVVGHGAQRHGRARAGGLPAQPHTSAGRVPTEKGYRFFVDALGDPAVGCDADGPAGAVVLRPGPRRARADARRHQPPARRPHRLRRGRRRPAARGGHRPLGAAGRRSTPARSLLVVVLSNGVVEKRHHRARRRRRRARPRPRPPPHLVGAAGIGRPLDRRGRPPPAAHAGADEDPSVDAALPRSRGAHPTTSRPGLRRRRLPHGRVVRRRRDRRRGAHDPRAAVRGGVAAPATCSTAASTWPSAPRPAWRRWPTAPSSWPPTRSTASPPARSACSGPTRMNYPQALAAVAVVEPAARRTG